MGTPSILIGILSLAAFIYVVYSVWTDKDSSYTPLMKIVWTVAAFFFSIITAIVYFVIDRQKKS